MLIVFPMLTELVEGFPMYATGPHPTGRGVVTVKPLVGGRARIDWHDGYTAADYEWWEGW